MATKKLTTDQWLEIKTRYELGHTLRKIADDYKCDFTIISKKAKKENWEKGRLQQDVQTATTIIADIATNLQQPALKVVMKEMDDKISILNSIFNLDKGAINLHNIILKKAIAQTSAGDITLKDASQITASMGLSIDKVAARAGLKETSTNIQINSSINNKIKIDSDVDSITASRRYQDFMKSE